MKSKANIAIFVPHAGCPHRCSFCDQRAISGQRRPPTPTEVTRLLTQAVTELSVETQAEIAFFGGSFTAIPRREMEGLLAAAAPFIDGKRIIGIRCSTRPDAVDESVLSILRYYGVSAIELGAQSMSDEVLALNRRGHTAQDVVRASRLIRDSRLELGLQMMTGLYGSTETVDAQTAEQLIALQPNTVRIYPTLVLRHTYLEELYRNGHYVPPTLDDTVALCARLLQRFEESGIRVIKLGLHAGSEPSVVAGPCHPALRELCENQIYYRNAKELLCDDDKQVTLRVHPACVSKMVGHHRSNLQRLAQEGVFATVKGDSTLLPGEIQKGEISCS